MRFICPKPMMAVALATLTLNAAASGGASESVFDVADEYTVRVRTVIEYGLGDDGIGAFTGTGFVVDAKRGWIVTNRHVVGESPSFVEISLKSEAYIDAKKLYVDPYIDVAILSVKPEAVTHEANLACNPSALPKGHPVGAYGHPWGFEYTGTQGVVSGVTQKFGPKMVQTDAPINSGNSGGPLISLETGDVVGVNTAKISQEGVESLGFAVPINEVCQIISLLKADRDPAPPDMSATFFGLQDSDAVIVAKPYAAARSLGFEPNDEVVYIGADRDPIEGYHDLLTKLRGSLDDVHLHVRRGGELIELRGTLPAQEVRRGVAFSGLVFAPFYFRDLASMSLAHDIGIQNVVSGSRGSAMDVNLWDLLHRINGSEISSLEHLYVVLSGLEAGSQVTLDLLRPLEDGHVFRPIRRHVVAEQPIWLDNAGEAVGMAIRVAWAESEFRGQEYLSQREQRMLRKILNDLSDPGLDLTASDRAELARRTQEVLDAGTTRDNALTKNSVSDYSSD